MKCNVKRFFAAVGAAFVFVFLFEWIFHGKLMMGLYRETAHLWRPEHDMGKYFLYMVLMQIALVSMLGLIFVKGYENKGIGEGVRFGLYLGGLLAIPSLAMYGYMPIPFTLPVGWLIGVLLEVVGIGVIFSLIYKPAEQ